MDSRVHEHDATELLLVAQSPAKRDRATPVMSDSDHTTRQLQFVRQRAQVIDPLGQTPNPAGALRESHIKMIDGDHANILWRLSNQVTPEIGPRRVPVDTQQCERRILHTVVEDVPRATNIIEIRGRDEP
jgi:hypothetical protein